MFQPGPNDALSQNFMDLGLLVAEKNVDTQTDTQDSFSISINCLYLIDTKNIMSFFLSQIEEMEVSHGVIVKEGGRVKKGPGRVSLFI